MDVRPDLRFVPVEGESLQDSTRRKLMLLALDTFVFIPISALVAWLWWNDVVFAGRQVKTIWGIISIVTLAIGIVAWPLILFWLFRRSRMVFGAHHWQIVDGETVSIQIPYRNIARLELGKDSDGDDRLFLDLIDPTDPDTLRPGAETNKKLSGWHHTQDRDAWPLTVPAVYDKLTSHLLKAGRTDLV